jgi:sulfur carrier protein ThiS
VIIDKNNNLTGMVLDRLCQIEESAKLSIKKEQERIRTTQALKALLKEVNLRAELIPADNETQIIELFQNLKGKELDQVELQVVREII